MSLRRSAALRRSSRRATLRVIESLETRRLLTTPTFAWDLNTPAAAPTVLFDPNGNVIATPMVSRWT